MLTSSLYTWQTRWDNSSFAWTCWHTWKIDEVLRAYLCQFTCINTSAASPSLGFYLRLITLYLLMPCRNMHFFPPGEEKLDPEKCSLFLQLAGALSASSFRTWLVKMLKSLPWGSCSRWGFTHSLTGHWGALLEKGHYSCCTFPWHLLCIRFSSPPPYINTKCPEKEFQRREGCKTTNLSLKGRCMITSAFVPVTCPCRTEKSFEHTPRRAGNLSYRSLVK